MLKEDILDLSKYLDFLIVIVIHNLMTRSASPNSLSLCLFAFRFFSLPAYVDLSLVITPCPPSPRHVSVEARQLLPIS